MGRGSSPRGVGRPSAPEEAIAGDDVAEAPAASRAADERERISPLSPRRLATL